MVEERRMMTAHHRGNTFFRALILASACLMSVASSGVFGSDTQAAGKALATDRSKGNCLACHVMADGEQPGTLGPPLIAMKARFPDAKVLYEQIWDATRNNPETRMPPFGKHGVLTAEEIELIIEYLYTL